MPARYEDFIITASASEALAPTLGSSAAWTINLKRSGSSGFGADISLSVEALPGEAVTKLAGF